MVAASTCDDLKVAVFDLDAAVGDGLGDLALSDDPDLADAEVGMVVVDALTGFYDRLAEIAEKAPAEIDTALAELAHAIDPWRELADVANAADEIEELAPSDLETAAVHQAADTVSRWTERWCGAEIATGPEEVMFTTVFSAMFAALGGSFADLADVFGSDPPPEPDTAAVAYGDDPILDGLYERCGTGDGQACRDLYFSAYGEYELWGQTCGASIPLRPAFEVDCTGKFAGTAFAYGDDFVLDTLWDECEAGELTSCDALFAAAPFGSDYEEFGGSCAGARDGDFSRPCVFVASGEPFGYGDDLSLDMLWDTCSVGDGVACDDLFFQTPIGSAYEAFGRVCGDLTALGHTCENAASWLGGPVG